jgi:DNA-binding transcriptional MocR family regulator
MGKEKPLYEKLADEMIVQIEAGTFPVGEKIPSVRESSEQKNLSVTTVLQAYRLVEDRGFIEARPQSGYYVRNRREQENPDKSSDSDFCSELSTPSEVEFSDLVMKVMYDSANTSLLQLGAALPDSAQLPSAKLARLMSVVARDSRYANSYGIPEGCDELRMQVAQRAFINGCNISPQEIVITNGCVEAIYLALSTVCRPGDLVAVESPTYFCVFKTLSSLGLKVIEIPTHRRSGVSLEALRFAINNHPIRACLFITNFNNPLGCSMSDENKRELAELIAKHDIALIEDDIWGEIYFTGRRPRTVKSFDKSGNVLLCSSFSKDISPSSRVGWIAPGRWSVEIARKKLSLNVGTSIIPQLAIARFLSSGGYDHHLRTLRKVYHNKVYSLVDSLYRYFPKGTRVSEPQGGFVVWVELPGEASGYDLFRSALKKGISTAPGNLFSATGNFKNCIRLNAACWSAKHDDAVKTLGRIAQGLVG